MHKSKSVIQCFLGLIFCMLTSSCRIEISSNDPVEDPTACASGQVYCKTADKCCKASETCGKYVCVPKDHQECIICNKQNSSDTNCNANVQAYVLCVKGQDCCQASLNSASGTITRSFCVPEGVIDCFYQLDVETVTTKFCYCPPLTKKRRTNDEFCFPEQVNRCSDYGDLYCNGTECFIGYGSTEFSCRGDLPVMKALKYTCL